MHLATAELALVPNASSHRERQAAGIAAARDRGVYLGRKPGTTKSKPDRAKRLRDRGLTDAETAASLGVSRRTVQRYVNG
ncbi:MAG: helix-turn-helix domain-containing protein [Pirellulales bacterium]